MLRCVGVDNSGHRALWSKDAKRYGYVARPVCLVRRGRCRTGREVLQRTGASRSSLKVVCYLRIGSNILVRGSDVRPVNISDQEELDSLQHMYVSVHSLDQDSITCLIDWFWLSLILQLSK
jgi:hypothetical protein